VEKFAKPRRIDGVESLDRGGLLDASVEADGAPQSCCERILLRVARPRFIRQNYDQIAILK
jgi:hypothetical protein